MLELTGRLPDAVVACVGGGSNAIGIFPAFLDDPSVALLRRRGRRRRRRDRSARRDASPAARPACCTARAPTSCRTSDGQTVESHSICAGLDYPGVGPEHAYLHEIGRAHYEPITDTEAMEAFRLLCRTEGIIPAIETAHALAGATAARPRARPRRRHPGEPARAAATRTSRPRAAGSACSRASARRRVGA